MSAERLPLTSRLDRGRPVHRSVSASGGLAGHFIRLWLGRPSLSRIFWNDLLLVGTAISLTATLLGYLTLAADAPAAVSLAISLSPLPYNLLLVTAVWRSADVTLSDWAWPARAAAVAWLLVVTMV